MLAKLIAVLLLVSIPLAAQDKPDRTSWATVQALRPTMSIYVKTAKHQVRCELVKDDADSLTCTKAQKVLTFQRSEVKRVKLSHRGRSILIGVAPGTGIAIGGMVGLAAAKCGSNAILCGLGATIVFVGGILVAGIGAGVGAGTDFARTPVYDAPKALAVH